ncbi:MAG: Y-family DNA polymerase [bacterium]
MFNQDQVFALVDCNNFYVSCERVFNPRIRDKPVVVLSNNDGCVVSRSEQAKQLGIGMGTPIFKCEQLIKKFDVQVFSSNYSLYADMSSRVMDVLRKFSPQVEIYSIDEAFLCVEKFKQKDYREYGEEIRETVAKWTGIPVSIGIAETKTLAKVANRFAKRDVDLKGVFNLTGHPDQDSFLKQVEIEDIWGIGPKYSLMLRKKGIVDGLMFKNTDENWVRERMTVTGQKTLLELRGKNCVELEMIPPDKKGITCSRSFGQPVEKFELLQQALATYISRAAEKLRKQDSIPLSMHIFITTNRFNQDEPQYANWIDIKLSKPTSYTPYLISLARENLGKIYKSGYRYKKVGVTFTGIIPSKEVQPGFFYHPDDVLNDHRFMKILDQINDRWGRNTVGFSLPGKKPSWSMSQKKLSPKFTTAWDQIPVVYCD